MRPGRLKAPRPPPATERNQRLSSGKPPDHAGARDLKQRTIAGDLELGVRVRLAEVSHRAVVGDPGAAVGPELDVGRTIEAADAVHKGLLEGLVEGEAADLELERPVIIVPLSLVVSVPVFVAAAVEVDELDLMPDFRCPVRRREAEVALERIQRGAALYRAADKGVRHEGNAGERGVRGLDRQGRRDRLRRECEHVVDRNILAQNFGEARRRAKARRIGWIGNAEIVARAADRIEHRLAARKEPKAIRPAMIVRSAILVLLRQMQPVRCIVGGACATLVGAVLAHQHPALQWVILGCEGNGKAVTVSP